MSEPGSYRQPTATHEALRLRARVNATVRAFMAGRGILEVETPVMSPAGNTDPNIASFTVDFSGRTAVGRRRWLRTSPEFPLKRLLASGLGDCYELGRVFRDGEAGGRHNPEFTMLEWYRLGLDERQLADEAATLVLDCLALVGKTASVERVSYRDLYRGRAGVDPFTASDEALRTALRLDMMDPAGLERDDWLDLLMTHRLQPGFAADVITIVHDYPASQCALARLRAGDPPVAARFELYLGTLELANGYHELTDPDEQRDRFNRDARRRRTRGLPAVPPDGHLLAALAHGLPDCAGVALGLDRLLMSMMETRCIADVLAFDFESA